MGGLFHSRDGNISVLFAILAFLIFGAAGLGLDYTLWTKQRAELQEAADAGAIAGAVALGNGGIDAKDRAEKRALKIAAANLDGPASAASGSANADAVARTVSVSYALSGRRSISAVLIGSNPDLRVSSTAKVVSKVVACIFALNPAASKAMNGNGSAVLQGTNCAIQVNSTAADGLFNTGTINATHICVAGSFTGSGYSPSPQAGCPVADDPFADAVIPSAGACTATSLHITSDRSLSPGVYCNGLSVASGATVKLNPGVYHVVNGPMTVSGGASVIGDGVVFVLSGLASMDITGNGEVVTTPPSTGDLAGFSIVQDRAAPLGEVSKISGEGRFEFPGIIYLPRQTLEIRGQAAGNAYVPTYAAVAADKIIVAGDGELRVTANTAHLSKEDAEKLTQINVSLIK